MDDLAQRQRLRPEDGSARKLPVVVVLGQVVEGRVELRLGPAWQPEGIDLSDHVAAHAVGAH
jgi:hypothetical protein